MQIAQKELEAVDDISKSLPPEVQIRLKTMQEDDAAMQSQVLPIISQLFGKDIKAPAKSKNQMMMEAIKLENEAKLKAMIEMAGEKAKFRQDPLFRVAADAALKAAVGFETDPDKLVGIIEQTMTKLKESQQRAAGTEGQNTMSGQLTDQAIMQQLAPIMTNPTALNQAAMMLESSGVPREKILLMIQQLRANAK
jgi:predicted RNA-binding protein with RPS1 domain